jgi:hypothetical protein
MALSASRGNAGNGMIYILFYLIYFFWCSIGTGIAQSV